VPHHTTEAAGSTSPRHSSQIVWHNGRLPCGKRPAKPGGPIDSNCCIPAALREPPTGAGKSPCLRPKPQTLSIPCANLAHHPAHAIHPMSTNWPPPSLDPTKIGPSILYMQPTSPGRPPSQVSGNHHPRWGTPRAQERTITNPQIKRCRQSAYLLHTYTTATGYPEQSRRRAITHSETLYHDPRLMGSGHGVLSRAAPCLAGFDTAGGFPRAPTCQYLTTASLRGQVAAYNYLLTEYTLDSDPPAIREICWR